eukprot:10410962-Lingulodinium_polyedra.AAC.1
MSYSARLNRGSTQPAVGRRLTGLTVGSRVRRRTYIGAGPATATGVYCREGRSVAVCRCVFPK